MRSVTLSDGIVLPKGSRLMIHGKFHDPDTYKNPDEFDAARFLNLRVTECNNNNYQYVSTSAEMFGFGMIAYSWTKKLHSLTMM